MDLLLGDYDAPLSSDYDGEVTTATVVSAVPVKMVISNGWATPGLKPQPPPIVIVMSSHGQLSVAEQNGQRKGSNSH